MIHVLTWDYKEPPPWTLINSAMLDFDHPHLVGIDTDSDTMAVAVGEYELTDEAAKSAYSEQR